MTLACRTARLCGPGPRSSVASVTSSSLTGATRSFSQRARAATTTKGHVYERTLESSLGRYAEPVKCVLSFALHDAYASAVSVVMILEEVCLQGDFLPGYEVPDNLFLSRVAGHIFLSGAICSIHWRCFLTFYWSALLSCVTSSPSWLLSFLCTSVSSSRLSSWLRL